MQPASHRSMPSITSHHNCINMISYTSTPPPTPRALHMLLSMTTRTVRHSISYQKDINTDKVRLAYREVINHTLDEAEFATIEPFTRTY